MSFKKKTMATITAVSLVALIVMGTFAWTNFSAQIVNVFMGLGAGNGGTDPISPGGTLHNDHNEGDENRQVYIENWGTEPLFVRIRLDEYMEMGTGAGYKSNATDPGAGESIPHPQNLAESVVSGASIDVVGTWTPHVPNESTPHECDSVFHDFWQWEMGGQKFFFPAPESDREDPSFVATGSPANLTEDSTNADGVYAQQTRSAEVITMAQWLDDGSTIGDYWVIDTDGWAYWAAPLLPGNATGLLLSRVTQTTQPEYDYFYGINVVAQMATQGLHEVDNYERFGDDVNGGWTANGQMLIELITNTEALTSQTYNNLIDAILGETYASMKYRAFADRALEEGYPTIANLFMATANAEEKHADDQWLLLEAMGATERPVVTSTPTVGTTAENLQVAIDGETYEYSVMYPEFLQVAQEEGFTDAARIFRWAMRAEEVHAITFTSVLNNIADAEYLANYAVVYRCYLCGEVVTERPESCGICRLSGDEYIEYNIN